MAFHEFFNTHRKVFMRIAVFKRLKTHCYCLRVIRNGLGTSQAFVWLQEITALRFPSNWYHSRAKELTLIPTNCWCSTTHDSIYMRQTEHAYSAITTVTSNLLMVKIRKYIERIQRQQNRPHRVKNWRSEKPLSMNCWIDSLKMKNSFTRRLLRFSGTCIPINCNYLAAIQRSSRKLATLEEQIWIHSRFAQNQLWDLMKIFGN